jgi:hypothetical protein
MGYLIVSFYTSSFYWLIKQFSKHSNSKFKLKMKIEKKTFKILKSKKFDTILV